MGVGVPVLYKVKMMNGYVKNTGQLYPKNIVNSIQWLKENTKRVKLMNGVCLVSGQNAKIKLTKTPGQSISFIFEFD
jgi:hypothetical protein